MIPRLSDDVIRAARREGREHVARIWRSFMHVAGGTEAAVHWAENREHWRRSEAEADMDTPNTREELEAAGLTAEQLHDQLTKGDRRYRKLAIEGAISEDTTTVTLRRTFATGGLARVLALAAEKGIPLEIVETGKLGAGDEAMLEKLAAELAERDRSAKLAAEAASIGHKMRFKGNRGKFDAAVAKRRAKGKAQRKAARRGGKGRR